MEKEDKPTKMEYFIVWICGTAVVTMIILAIFASNVAPNFLVSDGYCNKLINNATINANIIGVEYTIATITQEVIQCNTIPINYGGYNYTLGALECLNLNLSQGDK